MLMVFSNINSVVIYIDDIFVFTDNFENHLKALSQVFDKLRSANLKINFKKCKLFKDTIKVLGHIVCKGKIMMDPEKIEAIQKWPQPTKVKHVQQFLLVS